MMGLINHEARPSQYHGIDRSHEDSHSVNKPEGMDPLGKITSSSNGKRPRASRPCDECRRKKAKCIIDEKPPCSLCHSQRQSCTFVDGPPPRRRKTGDDTVNDTLSHDSAVGLRKSSPKARVGKAKSTKGTTRSGPRQTPPSPVRDLTLSFEDFRDSTYIGQSSALDLALLKACPFNSSGSTSLGSEHIRKVAPTQLFQVKYQEDLHIHQQNQHAIHEIERLVAPSGPNLMDMFFEQVHPSLPIVQKEIFLRSHARLDQRMDPALLAVVYIMALQWWQSHPALLQHRPPDVGSLEMIALRHLELGLAQSTLSSLQAGLLLLQRSHTNPWQLTVRLVAVAQDLGLHLDCSDWSIPLWERRLRKRLAWAVYMQDKWSSLIYGRPSHIQAAEWAVPALILADFDEDLTSESNRPTAVSTAEAAPADAVIFLQMIELTSIMAEVVAIFYTQTGIAEIDRAGSSATQLILSKAKPVQLKLKEWFARLPAEAKLDSADARNASSAAYLHLAYYGTEISIHRRIVQSLPTSTTDSLSAGENYTLYICRSAAKTRLISAMEFVNRLRPEQLDGFWYFPSGHDLALIATFGALLRATAPGGEEADFYAARLGEMKWALAMSARRAPWIETAIRTLDAAVGVVDAMAEKSIDGDVGRG